MSNETSARFKCNIERIMSEWEKRANREVLAAMQLESLSLRNSLPELLDHIAQSLSTSTDRVTARKRWERPQDGLRVGEKHGRERARTLNYTMDQMIFEYHILRRVIFDVMEEEAPFSQVEREVVLSTIEQAVNDAATQFSKTLVRIQERLATALTHDLRGPITSTKIHAQLMLRREASASEGIKAAAHRILVGMDRLDSMIQDLLDASLIRAGETLPMKIEECDLEAITQETVGDYNMVYGNRFVFVSDGPVRGYWSPNEIRRVIENLATNAAKYSTPNTPITVRIQQTDSKVDLSVHNEGEPISSEDKAMLFHQFRRTKSSESLPGWGLGLTVVKGIAEAHRGTVEVESLAGKGTTFTVHLPRDARNLELLECEPLPGLVSAPDRKETGSARSSERTKPGKNEKSV